MFAETLLIEVGRALDIAVIVRSLGIFIDLEGTLTTSWHIGVHEGSCVLLELRAL